MPLLCFNSVKLGLLCQTLQTMLLFFQIQIDALEQYHIISIRISYSYSNVHTVYSG